MSSNPHRCPEFLRKVRQISEESEAAPRQERRIAVSEAIAEARAGGARLQPACARGGADPAHLPALAPRGHPQRDARAASTASETPYDPPNRLSRRAQPFGGRQPRRASPSSSPQPRSSPRWPTRAATSPRNRTFYRLLRADGSTRPRAPARPAPRPGAPSRGRPPAPTRSGPWDITYLATNAARDASSTSTSSWTSTAARSSAGRSTPQAVHRARRRALRRAPHLRAAVGPPDLVLHSDNGSPHEGRHPARDPPAPRRRALLQPTLGAATTTPTPRRGFATLKGSPAAAGRQDRADADVAARDQAVGLGMARWDEAVLAVLCVADPITAMLDHTLFLHGSSNCS